MLFTPGVVGIALIVAGVVSGGFLVARWRELRTQNRRYLLSVLTVQAVVLIGIAYTYWPTLPSSQAAALSVADQFLDRWSSGRTEEAKQLMDGINVEDAWRILGDRSRAPATWTIEWVNPRNHIALGRGQLVTGEAIEIAVFMDWNWLNNTWKVTGVQFTTANQEHPIGVYLVYDNGSHILFEWALALVGWISIAMGAWRMRALMTAWKGRHGQQVATG